MQLSLLQGWSDSIRGPVVKNDWFFMAMIMCHPLQGKTTQCSLFLWPVMVAQWRSFYQFPLKKELVEKEEKIFQAQYHFDTKVTWGCSSISCKAAGGKLQKRWLSGNPNQISTSPNFTTIVNCVADFCFGRGSNVHDSLVMSQRHTPGNWHLHGDISCIVTQLIPVRLCSCLLLSGGRSEVRLS